MRDPVDRIGGTALLLSLGLGLAGAIASYFDLARLEPFAYWAMGGALFVYICAGLVNNLRPSKRAEARQLKALWAAAELIDRMQKGQPLVDPPPSTATS